MINISFLHPNIGSKDYREGPGALKPQRCYWSVLRLYQIANEISKYSGFCLLFPIEMG